MMIGDFTPDTERYGMGGRVRKFRDKWMWTEDEHTGGRRMTTSTCLGSTHFTQIRSSYGLNITLPNNKLRSTTRGFGREKTQVSRTESHVRAGLLEREVSE